MENFEDLLDAIKENDVEKFMLLVDKIHLTSSDVDQAICEATENGNIEMLELVYSKLNISTESEETNILVHTVAERGDIEVVKFFHSKGFVLNNSKHRGYDVIHSAVLSGSLELIKWLIDNGSDTKALTESGYNLLHLASANNYIELMQLLLDQGFDINSTTEESETPVYIAAKYNKFDSVKFLFNHGANLNLTDYKGRNPIYWAAFHNDQAMVEWLYENKADIYSKYNRVDLCNQYREVAESLLHIAAENNNIKLIELLISKGFDPNIRTKINDYVGDELVFNYGEIPNYETPIHRAAKYGALEAIKSLFFYGAKLDVQDGFRETLMHSAAKKGHLDVIKWLYAQGLPIDPLGHAGRPIHQAAYDNKNYEVVKWLIEQGANINEDSRGESLLEITIVNKSSDIAILLLSHKVTIDVKYMDSLVRDTDTLLSQGKNVKEKIQGGLHIINTFKESLPKYHDASDVGHSFDHHSFHLYTRSRIIKFIKELSSKLVGIINNSDLDSIEASLTKKNLIERLTLQNEWLTTAQENDQELNDALMLIVDKLEKPKFKSLQKVLQVDPLHKLSKIAGDGHMLGTLVSFLSYPDQISLAKAYENQSDSLAAEDFEPEAKKSKIDGAQNDFDSTFEALVEMFESGKFNGEEYDTIYP